MQARPVSALSLCGAIEFLEADTLQSVHKALLAGLELGPDLLGGSVRAPQNLGTRIGEAQYNQSFIFKPGKIRI